MDHSQISRQLVESHSKGALSTLSIDPSGYPFGSVMPYVLDPGGNPVFLASDLAEHTINLKSDPRASLMVSEALAGGSDADPLSVARVTLLGTVVPGGDEHRDAYLLKHSYASTYVDFNDFSFYSMQVTAVRYVGGFGQMSWADVADYRAAKAPTDEVAHAASDIIEHMNEDHNDALVDLAMGLGGQTSVRSATMLSVDPEGFVMRVETPDGSEDVRLGFVNTASEPEQVRVEIIRLLKAARAKLQPS